jgi:hypothetical protein
MPWSVRHHWPGRFLLCSPSRRDKISMKGGENVADVNTFPGTPVEAIAYLYVQTQDLTGKTPVQIYEMYLDAYYQILKDRNKKKSEDWFSQKQEEVLKD